MRPAVGIVGAVLCSAAAIAVLWTELIPLGVPGEWTWARLTYSAGALSWGVLIAFMAGAVYLGVAVAGVRWVPGASPGWAVAWITALLIAGFAWLWGVQSAAIEGVGMGKAPYVLYYRRTEGYYWQARWEMDSTLSFLQGYEALLAERDYLHIGTHPPGLALLHRGLIGACEASPGLTRLGLRLTPDSVQRALSLMESSERSSGRSFNDVDRAALWWAALLTQFAVVLTIVPLYGWLRLCSSAEASWRAVSFWPLVPAIGVFLPKSDLLYPLIAMSCAYLWRRGWRDGGAVWCAAAGATFFCGMMLSLAFLPIAALIGVQTLCDGWPLANRGDSGADARAGGPGRLLRLLAAGLGGFALGVGIAGALGLNLLNVWLWNLSNHALFYQHNARTYWKWLLVNPVELLMAAGLPVVVLIKWGVFARLRAGDWSTLQRSAVPSFCLVWGLLWLSGKNMGEVARLWVPLMPWLIACTAIAFAPDEAPASTDRDSHSTLKRSGSGMDSLWKGILVLQVVVAIATVLAVDGFHFTELVSP